MTNDDLEKKIAEIIDSSVDDWATRDRRGRIQVHVSTIADILVKAGLKFDAPISHTATFDMLQQDRINELEKRIAEAEHRAARAEHELERRLAEATKAMYVYERALYYATLNGETADEVKYNDALKRAQKDFAENKGD